MKLKIKMKNSFFEENPWSNLLILINNFILCITTLIKIEKLTVHYFFMHLMVLSLCITLNNKQLGNTKIVLMQFSLVCSFSY